MLLLLGLFSSCGDSLALEESKIDLSEEPSSNATSTCSGFLGATGYGEINAGDGVHKFSYHYNPRRPSRNKFVVTTKDGDVLKGILTSAIGYGSAHTLHGRVLTENGNSSNLNMSITGGDKSRRGAGSDILGYSISDNRRRSLTVLQKGDITDVYGPCDDCCNGLPN